jgi:exodeoxyribonuclease V alpha subunit
MAEAIGRESMTSAAFIQNLDELKLGDGSILVIDKASMIDVILMYRLLKYIPPGTRIILVGDSSQLPSIGLGLVLHGHPEVTQTELKVMKRQTESSGIPVVAKAVTNHEMHEFLKYAG